MAHGPSPRENIPRSPNPVEDVAESADEVLQRTDRRCKRCDGKGTRATYKTHLVTCNCAFRAIFRACFAHFRDCSLTGAFPGTISWEFCPGSCGRRVYSRKQEEYVADFLSLSHRALDDRDYLIFRSYFLLGMSWSSCASMVGIDRGNFFHTIYRIERVLGRAFLETKPYALYPLDEYFNMTFRAHGVGGTS